MKFNAKKRNSLMSAVALAALSSAPIAARSANTVMDVIADNPDHQLFVEAASATGMDELLDSEYGFTLFLPTDDVLERAGIDMQLSEPLSPDEERQLVEVLRNHIVFDEVTRTDAGTPNTFETVSGAPVNLSTSDGITRVNEATVVKHGIVAKNGVVHVIDSLLSSDS